jgi:hypothetical protein
MPRKTMRPSQEEILEQQRAEYAQFYAMLPCSIIQLMGEAERVGISAVVHKYENGKLSVTFEFAQVQFEVPLWDMSSTVGNQLSIEGETHWSQRDAVQAVINAIEDYKYELEQEHQQEKLYHSALSKLTPEEAHILQERFMRLGRCLV